MLTNINCRKAGKDVKDGKSFATVPIQLLENHDGNENGNNTKQKI